MGIKEPERYFGEQFIQNQRYARIGSMMTKGMAGTSIALGGLNFFIAPDDRLEYTVVPVLGGAAMLGANRLWQKLVNKLNDATIAEAIKGWDSEDY